MDKIPSMTADPFKISAYREKNREVALEKAWFVFLEQRRKDHFMYLYRYHNSDTQIK